MKAVRFLGMGVMALGLILATMGKNLAAETKYPSKPIQIIIAFQPGATDVLLRPYIEKIPDYLGQPMTFVYKPGAGGALGAGIVTAAKPDGYTLLGTTESAMSILPHTQKDIDYTLESFAPICCLVDAAMMILVQSNARWKNIKDLVAEAKKNPGKINWTSSGTFAITHLMGEAFSKEAGIKLNHIPSQGGGPAVTALLGGHVDMGVITLGSGFPHIKSGGLRSLAIFSQKRLKALSDVPTVSEMGYAIASSITYGIVGPRGMPKEVIETLSSAAKKVLENHGDFITSRLSLLGAEPIFWGPEEYATFLKSQSLLAEKIVKEIKK